MKKIVENGYVYEISNGDERRLIGKVERLKLSIEHPERMLGISRVESLILCNEQGEELMNDPNIVDNQEYHSDSELISEISKRYNISKDLISLV